VPEVKVQLTEVEERIYVTILDKGPGIPASIRKTLFDPFVTEGNPTERALGSPWLVESLKNTLVASASRNRIENGPDSR
jgi:K+-sensing histidine kinase KdpD